MAEPQEFERVAPGIWRLPLITPTLPPATRTNTYAVSDRAGGLWLVDPGTPNPSEQARLLEWLDNAAAGVIPGITEGGLRGVVVTHHHLDHCAGLACILEATEAVVIALDPERVGAPRERARTVDWFHGEATGLQLLQTPGHASDHIVLVTPEGDAVVGDMVAGVGTILIAPPDGDMAIYLDSLQRMRELGLGRLFPAHGPALEDATACLDEYIAHRKTREAQVLSGLAALGSASPADLAAHIYVEVPPAFLPLAAQSVLAHLLKLEGEGLAAREGERWKACDARGRQSA